MPILHIHSPREIITAFPRRIQHSDWILGALRDLGAQATICEPGFVGDITPPLLRKEKIIPPRATIWLHVDDSGENGVATYYLGRGTPNPNLYGYGESETLKAVIIGHETEYRIGPEATEQFIIGGEAGHGITYRNLIGGLVLHHTAEEAAALIRSFEQSSEQPPPPLPPAE